VPYGEADLLLGLDADECLRAIDPEGELRVAGPDTTHTVANLGGFAGQEAARLGAHEHDPIATALRVVSRVEKLLVADFTTPCRSAFRTDRVADLVLLGAAYQRGLVPLSLEAIEGAVDRIEQRGIGRAREAFLFGRRLAEDERLFARPGQEQEEVGRVVRRARLEARRGGPRRDERMRFAALMQRCVSAMPGLAETDPGRVAQQDFLLALRRCQSWGGFAYARRYAELITNLYRADRGQQGRALTRCAILPLAEAMLIRDPVYVATVATSREERRRLRRTLNVKVARGDRVERRFLTRLELIAWQRRYRLDVRTGDWPAFILRAIRRVVPQNWRGSTRERKIKQRVMELANRATHGTESEYERYAESLHRLHEQARDERLRQMAISELQMLIGE
jgi:hypothetical protein